MPLRSKERGSYHDPHQISAATKRALRRPLQKGSDPLRKKQTIGKNKGSRKERHFPNSAFRLLYSTPYLVQAPVVNKVIAHRLLPGLPTLLSSLLWLSSASLTHTHALTVIYSHKHTHSHTNAHMHSHNHTCTHAQSHMYMHIHAFVQMIIHAHNHTLARTHLFGAAPTSLQDQIQRFPKGSNRAALPGEPPWHSTQNGLFSPN